MLETFTTTIFIDALDKLHVVILICFIATVTFIIINYSLSFQHAVTGIMRYAIKRKKEDADFSIMDIQWYISNVYPNHQYRPGLKELFSVQNEAIISKYLEKKHFYHMIGCYYLNRDIVVSYKDPLTKIFPEHKKELLKNIQKIISDIGISGEVEAAIFHVLMNNELTNCNNIDEFAQLFIAQFPHAGKIPKWVAKKYKEMFVMDSGSQNALYQRDAKTKKLYNDVKSLILSDIENTENKSNCS